MTTTPPTVRVVTVYFNSADALPDFIASIGEASTRPVEIVVVDNASPIPVPPLPEGVRVVRASANLGYGGGANLGLTGAVAPWLVVANPDVTWSPGSLDVLLEHAERWPHAAVLGPAVLEPDGTPYPSARRFPALGTGIGHALLSRIWPGNPWSRAYRQEGVDAAADRVTDWLSGSCMLLRRSAFEQVGGFDESYFMFFEDVDICRRLADAGWSSVYVPAARVHHDQGHSWRSKPAAMLRAHHASAYRYLAGRYPRAWHAPLRALLRVALAARLRFQLARSAR